MNKFKEETTKDLKEFETYLLEENITLIKEKAHYIKNSCLNLCLDDAVLILNTIETKYEDISTLKYEYKKLEAILKNLK